MNILVKWLVIGLILSCCWSCKLVNPYRVNEPKKDPRPLHFSAEQTALGYYGKTRSCYDVLHYDIEIEPQPDHRTITGSVTFTNRLLTASDTLQIDLHAHLDIKGIFWENQTTPLPFTRKYRAILFSIKEMGIQPGDVFKFRVEYHGKPPKAKRPPWRGGTVWKKDKNKNPWLGVACESDGSSIWFPCKDHTADEADSIDFHIICSNDLIGVSNGVLVGVDTLENQQLKFNWRTSYPINTYNITYYVGDFTTISDTIHAQRGLVNLTHYVLKENLGFAKEHFKQVHDIFHFYEEKFGPYSWVNDGFKLVESPYEGMEHQTAIAYGNGYKNTLRIFSDYIILHETAHEWWGNSVSVHDLAHVWIHEGFATYSEALYAEHVGGVEAYDNKIFMDRLFINNKRPVVGPEGFRHFDYRDSDVYNKGSVILHTLRKVMDNDSLFFDVVRQFYAINETKIVSTTDFTTLVNELTQTNYDWFFNQYLYQRHVPVLNFFLGDDGYLYHQWTNCNSDFKMETQIKIDEVSYNISATTKLERSSIHHLKEETRYLWDAFDKYYSTKKIEEEVIDTYKESLDEQNATSDF